MSEDKITVDEAINEFHEEDLCTTLDEDRVLTEEDLKQTSKEEE